jgi:maltooligosyltrehalose trehalohydrolase
MPIGVEVDRNGAHARVWAPEHRDVALAIEGRAAIPLEREPGGYWSGAAPGARPGDRYRFRVDGELLPDPASRWQPEGPHGPSAIVDASSFHWTDSGWRGRTLREAVIYELHVGTFTREGTWRAAAEKLPELARLGITVVETMPLAEFAGSFGWGYDGVTLFAPHHVYGEPDDVRAFVDRAHALGIAVVVDVVYNHLGPDGNHLARYSRRYFTECHRTDWGAAIDFYGEGTGPVRELFVSNAVYWIDEHHFDGLRIDATQNVYDFGQGEHVIAEITRRVRDAAGDRRILVIAENESQDAHFVLPRERGGHGVDAVWNDDLHHSAVVALTGRREAYYTDYDGSARELAAASRGWLYQGQRYAWQSQRRGTSPRGAPPESFVSFLENHDQVANSLDGERLHAVVAPSAHRAMTAFFLLAPGTPLLFQGDELDDPPPFLYFADHRPELARLVARGRAEFLSQFASIALPDCLARLPPPDARSTFERCRLPSAGSAPGRRYEMIRSLLALRAGDPALSGAGRVAVELAPITDRAFVIRYFARDDRDDRLVVVNLGPDASLVSCSEPLVAPPFQTRWWNVWSSEDPAWGGRGSRRFESESGLGLTASTTLLLAPEPDPVPRREELRR